MAETSDRTSNSLRRIDENQPHHFAAMAVGIKPGQQSAEQMPSQQVRTGRAGQAAHIPRSRTM